MRNTYVDLANQIRTYTEEIYEDSQINCIKETVSKATLVILLGFGFHPQNLDILTSDKAGSMLKDIFATGFKLSPFNCRYYGDDMLRRFNCSLPTVDPLQTCVSLLDSYSAIIFA
jgi:hypothetical protein